MLTKVEFDALLPDSKVESSIFVSAETINTKSPSRQCENVTLSCGCVNHGIVI